jgi:hypothetical protein
MLLLMVCSPVILGLRNVRCYEWCRRLPHSDNVGAALSWKRQLIQGETVESRVNSGFTAD